MKRYLFVGIGLALLVAGLAVRAQNGRSAQTQANTIVTQDTAGTDTAASQADLANFVKLHTGASVTYTLTGAYNRDLNAAKATSAAQVAANSQIYADAQRVCGGKTDSVTQSKCNSDYLTQHLLPVQAAPVATPNLASYQRRLTSPLWTADLAGSLLLGGVIALAVGIVKIIPKRRRR